MLGNNVGYRELERITIERIESLVGNNAWYREPDRRIGEAIEIKTG